MSSSTTAKRNVRIVRSEALKRQEQSDATARKIVVIALAVVGLTLLSLISIGMMRLLNAESEARRCVVVRRLNVEPTTPALPAGAAQEPVAFGYVYTDVRQRLLWLSLADDYTANGVDISGIELRGPLDASSPFEAPTALQIPTTRNDAAQRFVGNATLDTRLAVEIDNNPAAYYLALFTGFAGQRREIGRDYLNKIC